MAKMGRPLIQIDQKQFENLCGLMCTLDDIAGWFKCSPDTIENWCKRTYKCTFSEVYKKHCAAGKISLRRNQFKLSEKNAAMAIFLGQQYLGQRNYTMIEGNMEADVKISKEQDLTTEELKKLAKNNPL